MAMRKLEFARDFIGDRYVGIAPFAVYHGSKAGAGFQGSTDERSRIETSRQIENRVWIGTNDGSNACLKRFGERGHPAVVARPIIHMSCQIPIGRSGSRFAV